MPPFLKERNFAFQIFFAMIFLMTVDTFISSSLSTRKQMEISLGEGYLIFEIIIALILIISALVLLIRNKSNGLRLVFLAYNTLLTVALLSDVFSLIQTLPKQKIGVIILLDALFIWVSNLVIFALWYWMVDGGGPEKRSKSLKKPRYDLMFPQEKEDLPGWEKWRPGFLDYFFLSFYSSMAFTPTDTLILSRKLKFLLMLQALISVVVLAMIAARAINVIG